MIIATFNPIRRRGNLEAAMTLADIVAARARIAPLVRRTPLVPSAWLSARTGTDVRLKLESVQVTNSFKARGALNATAVYLDRHRGMREPAAPIVTASAGNHGRAMAYAAGRSGLRLVVYVPRAAPRAKLDYIARHGADLRLAESYEDAERLAKAWAEDHSATYISPYNHPDVVAGAGTVGVEILDEWPEVETIVVPVGGGGLVSGIAIAARASSGHVEVVGVETECSPAFHEALKAGHPVDVEVRQTLADGLAGNMDPETITFEYVRRLVDWCAVAPESAIADAIRGLAIADHVIAEGAGATAAAGLLAGVHTAGRCVAVVISGSNIDPELLAHVLRSG
jgi:threonine dehydratase